MATRDIVVIGASHGGIEAVKGILQKLPSDLPASLFLVQHMAADSTSDLSRILI